jgi:uncharacterized membrane protein
MTNPDHRSAFAHQVLLLAAIGLVLQALDLLTGVNMMARLGLGAEQNPLARFLVGSFGPAGLVAAKLGAVLAITYLFVRLEARGRGRLARNVLAIVAIVGLLGLVSNLV